MLKILISDDEYFARYGLRESINWEEYGYCIVAEAVDAHDAYEKYMQYKPDIVITDICMEETSGLDFIAKVKATDATPAKFVVLTGFAEFDYVKTALENGVHSYLLKPVKNNELLEKLNEIKKSIEEKQYVEKTVMNFRSILPYLKNNYLLDVLTGKTTSHSDIQEKFNNCGISLPTDFYITIIIKLDTSYTTNVSVLIEKSIENCLLEYEDFKCTLCSIDEATFALLVYCKEIDMHAINSLFFEIQNNFAVLSNLPLQIGISDIFDDLTNISTSYHQAMNALNDRYINKNSEIAFYNFLQNTSGYQQEVLRAIDIIKRDYAKPLTISQVSNDIFISPSHLMFIFKRDTGKTFNEFLTEYRLKFAIEMLKSNKYKIYEVAEKVGYKNSKYFTHIFKKYLNSTPKDYHKGG